MGNGDVDFRENYLSRKAIHPPASIPKKGEDTEDRYARKSNRSLGGERDIGNEMMGTGH